MTPVEPPKNAIGRNTADSTSAMPTSAPVICDIERRVASFGEPHSSSSAERRVGKEGVRPCRARWSPHPETQQNNKQSEKPQAAVKDRSKKIRQGYKTRN